MSRFFVLLAGATRFLALWLRPIRVWRLSAHYDAQQRKMQSLVVAFDEMFLANHREYVDTTVIPLASSVLVEAGDGEKVFRKEFRHPKGTGLTATQAFFLELDCLARINQVVSAQNTTRHFPTLHGFDVDNLSLELSFDGVSLNNLSSQQVVPDAEAQIDTIVATLERANICHLDIHESGKNLLVDSEGRLTLIDFNRAVIGNIPANSLVGRKLPQPDQQAEFHRARLHRCLEKQPLIARS